MSTATALANEHFDICIENRLELRDGAVWDGQTRLFNFGYPESGHVLRRMIEAWRAGRAQIDTWLPMDDAPRDGTLLLLAVDDAPNPRHIVTVGSWDESARCWDCALGLLGERTDADWDADCEWPVTHWKPLGDGPKQAEG